MRHALLAAAFGVLLALPVASHRCSARPHRRAGAAQERPRLPVGAAGAVPPAPPATLALRRWPCNPRQDFRCLLCCSRDGSRDGAFSAAGGDGSVASSFGCADRLCRGGMGSRSSTRLALEAGIHRRVEVLLHEALTGPMTCGVVHPAIVLPRDAQSWEAEDLNRAIVHELEHVRRGDWVSHCLARAVCAVYWFHPLVWIAWRQLALEAERSCDDAVLGRSEATAYADQLVGLARRLSAAGEIARCWRWRTVPIWRRASARCSTAGSGAAGRGRSRWRSPAPPRRLLVLTMSPLKVVARRSNPPLWRARLNRQRSFGRRQPGD